LKEYYTIKKRNSGFFKEKGSKFYSYSYPVFDQAEISFFLTDTKKKHFKASHHCYAWILGTVNQDYRANDDGEPAHSAGDPILGQIRSSNLTNTLIIVVRYFGGIKLGVGGLISAYRHAAILSLEGTDKQRIYVKKGLTLSFPYEMINNVERLIDLYKIEVRQRNYSQTCSIDCLVNIERIDELDQELSKLYLIKSTMYEIE